MRSDRGGQFRNGSELMAPEKSMHCPLCASRVLCVVSKKNTFIVLGCSDCRFKFSVTREQMRQHTVKLPSRDEINRMMPADDVEFRTAANPKRVQIGVSSGQRKWL